MRNWVWKFIPPREVLLAIGASKAFFARNGPLSQAIIEPEVLSLIKNPQVTLSAIRKEQMKPDQVALLHITHVLKKHLASGSQHLYLGVLSAIGADMLATWHKAQAERIERGYATESEVAEQNRWLKEKVNAAGKRGEAPFARDCFAC